MDSPREAVRDEMEWRVEACLDANDACRDATCKSHSHVIPCFDGAMLQPLFGLSHDLYMEGGLDTLAS